MMTLKELLKENKNLTDYKINTVETESSELFFVHRSLETVRHTHTLDTKGTVYVEHDGKMGDSEFTVYASNTEDEIREKIASSVNKALLINNAPYQLPKDEKADYKDASNILSLKEIAKLTSDAVYQADCYKDGSINAVEIFIKKMIIHVENSKGIDKTQVAYDCMIEAIPTWNGEKESVELYEQYHFNFFDAKKITEEIDEKMKAVRARYEAKKPENLTTSDVILLPQEIASLVHELAYDINYRTVYTHSNKNKIGDSLQTNPTGDLFNVTLKGQIQGSTESSYFDRDGVTLKDAKIITDGKVSAYFGSNQFGQYLGVEPTGNVRCCEVAAGTKSTDELKAKPYLEVISMSGIQIELLSDYIGGEIRLGYYFDGKEIRPVTGISMSGKLSEVLNSIELSKECEQSGAYFGPKMALLKNMMIA